MKLFILAVLSILLMNAPPASAQDIAIFYRSDHVGKSYMFTVTHAQLQATPDWPEDADNPPLSPRRALALARADLATFLPDAAKWKFLQITLTSAGAPHKWLYTVEFAEPLPPGVIDGNVETMRVPILMNGIAVPPVVTPAYPFHAAQMPRQSLSRQRSVESSCRCAAARCSRMLPEALRAAISGRRRCLISGKS